MRTHVSLILLLIAAPLFASQVQYRFDERITIDPSGAAAVVCTITPGAGSGLPAYIPFDHGTPSTPVTSSDSSITATFVVVEGIPQLRLTGTTVSNAPLILTTRIDTLPLWRGLKAGEFGNRTVAFSFRNTTTATVSGYTGTVVLPPGCVITSIVSSDPAQTEKEPAAPFSLFKDNGCTGISIRAKNLALSDGAEVTFRCKPGSHSLVLLAACSLTGILYLIFFRNVLKDNGNGSSAA
jgi:hypothetical protein